MYAKFGEDRIRITYGTVLYKLELIIMTLLCVHQIINGLDLVDVIRVRGSEVFFLQGGTLNHYNFYTNRYFGS